MQGYSNSLVTHEQLTHLSLLTHKDIILLKCLMSFIDIGCMLQYFKVY